MTNPPSLLRLLLKDHASLVLVVTVPVSWLACVVVYLAVLNAALGNPYLLWVVGGSAILDTLICGPWAIRRLLFIRRLLAHGAEVHARLSSVGENEGGRWMVLDYNYDGQPFQMKQAIGRTPAYEMGDSLVLLIDPDRPAKGIVRDRYADS